MLITTQNSTYKVTASGHYFLVEKVAETHPNHNGIELGWTIKCTQLSVIVGGYAKFDSIWTSIVQGVAK